MNRLFFASEDAALQYLADLTGLRVLVAAELAQRKEGEATFKTKLLDERGTPGKTLTVAYEWTAEKQKFSPVKLTELNVVSVKEAGDLHSITREDPKTKQRERGFYRKLESVFNKLDTKQLDRLDWEARKHFYDKIAPTIQF